jgi:glycine cleavage system aminomethyltransferase T
MQRTDRKQLVGLLAPEVLEEGAQLVADGPALGHVTSAYWSETLGRPIALALLSSGRARIGGACDGARELRQGRRPRAWLIGRIRLLHWPPRRRTAPPCG